MKRKLRTLSILSFAASLTLMGCNQAGLKTEEAPVVEDEDVLDDQVLPSYEPDELPEEDVIYDLTGEIEVPDNAITGDELEDLIQRYLGPSIPAVIRSTFPDIYNWFVEHNYFTERELLSILSIVQKHVKLGVQNPKDMIIDLAVNVNVDKLFATVRDMEQDADAFVGFKKFVRAVSNGQLELLDYQYADKFFNELDADIHSLAEQENSFWNNLRILEDDGIGMVEIIREFIHNDNIRILLRFVNHAAKVLVRDLNSYELGFILDGFNILHDDEFAALCQRYILSDIPSFVSHIGKAINAINVSDSTWQGILDGLRDGITIGSTSLSNGRDSLKTTENKFIDAMAENVALVYNGVDAKGFRILIKFLSGIINHVSPEFIHHVEDVVASGDISQLNLEYIVNLYKSELALLTSEERGLLDDQFTLFGIDFENFNTSIDEIDPKDQSALGPFMDLINMNIVYPIMTYFAGATNIGEVYDYPNGLHDLRIDDGKLMVLRKGDDFGETELTDYVMDPRGFDVHVNTYESELEQEYEGYDFDSNGYSDIKAKRTNLTFRGEIDTSEVGEGYVVAVFDAKFEISYRRQIVVDDGGHYEDDQWIPDSHTEWEYSTIEKVVEGVEARINYYVVEEDVETFNSGFTQTVAIKEDSSYHYRPIAKDSKGNTVAFNELGREVYIEQGVNYDSDLIFIGCIVDEMAYYNAEAKRFINPDDEYGYNTDIAYQDVAGLNNDELGTFVFVIEQNVYDYHGWNGEEPTLLYTFKALIKYTVVEHLDSNVYEGYYDPGFIY